MPTVSLANQTLDVEVCLEIIAGYAFGTRTVDFTTSPKVAGGPPAITEVARWAYRSYDCVEPAPGSALAPVDWLVTAGMNVEFDSRTATALQAIAPEVGEVLEELGDTPLFWELEGSELQALPPDSVPAVMTRAWALLVGMPHIGTAVAHKVLHHKKPHLFPILDGKTLEYFEEGQAWVQIHDDLTTQSGVFAGLESDFADFARRRGTRELTRLRIHDILLWCRATGDEEEAIQMGQRALSETR